MTGVIKITELDVCEKHQNLTYSTPSTRAVEYVKKKLANRAKLHIIDIGHPPKMQLEIRTKCSYRCIGYY